MDEQQRNIADVASSSKPSSAKKYDVFLSFRGEDTRLNFTSHLREALRDAGIVTFIDDQLEKGDEISPALNKAIEDSRISIVIFSEDYASSKWCLNELNKIMEEKGQIVIPVFYHIDPSDVRNQTGRYKEHLDKYEGHPMLGKWKAALTTAANLSGWHSSQNRSDSELLKDIVRVVRGKLPRTYPNQLKKLVGIEESFEEIESLLEIGSNEVITLGIWGMGGIGKTTLAEALYKKLSDQFEGCCFLPDVRGHSHNLQTLRDQLFSKCFKNENQGFDNFDMSRLRPKKLFIVLDDVSTPEQIEKLIEEYYFMGNGSRVIITTRDKQILSTATQIYPLKVLNPDYSLQLFCLSAFQEKQPKQLYEDLSRRVISHCKGVPLALKVLGACLEGKSEEAWESELIKLEKIPNKTTYDVLKISYDSLESSQKDIFLDIACFFKGENRDRVTEILKGFESASGIEVLLDKALITISNDNQIQMHDLIQEMGREVVHQESEKCPGKRSRLWKHEEVLHVLKYNKGTEDVKGIILDLFKLKEDLYMSHDFLAKMTNMRVLKIHEEHSQTRRFNMYFCDGLDPLLSDKLRYFYWDRYCLESLPPNFCAQQLVELYMRESNLTKLWDGAKNLVNLKTIDLSFSQNLMEIPDLSNAKKLERVYLVSCFSLRGLHPSMFSLPKLTYLYLRNCRKIESLKSNVHVKSLDVLEVQGCSSLKEFLVTSEKIKKLDFSYTALRALSPSIGRLLSLEELVLDGSNVESMPVDIKNLSKLTRLQLKDCRELVSLIELPPTLVELYLNDCRKLVSLPKLPSSLLKLCLNGCQELVSLVELPSFLTELHLNNCLKLEDLPKLPPSMKMVTAINCISLERGITQGLMLEHMCQSRIPYLHEQYLNNPEFDDVDYFIFPIDHITNKSGFHTAESSLTIHDLPKSDLLGFICCIILNKEQDLDISKDAIWDEDLGDGDLVYDIQIYIYQDGIEVGEQQIPIECPPKLIVDQVLFSYVDISRFSRISEVCDQFRSITFKFECDLLVEMIKGCGVFPVYATTSGLKLDEHHRINDVASSSDPSSDKKYDVFLSFRGEDTRLNFTSHLRKALYNAGIDTFIDNRLEKGDEISPALIKAIEHSQISIVIFSENYASSRWCLDELNKIMESKEKKGQIVIPVFYHIDPSDVRNQTGRYKEDLDKHEGHPMFSKWKDALTKAANLSGCHHNSYCNHESQETKAEKYHSKERTEAEVIENIVQDVSEKLARTYTNQRKRYVGIEKSHGEVESLLNIGSNAVITLGIWGMGGIGKTTLATALYEKLSDQFEGCCFLENVKDDKLTDLRNKLSSTLLGKEKQQFDSFDMSRLRRKKVLIVLDDVSKTEQLEKLIGEYDFLGAGSRVIITTRDKQVLSKVNETYEVKELNSQDSIQLFCLTAFGENQPKKGYENLSTGVISYCKGLPLALKVLGDSLKGKSEEAWESELRKLQNIPDEEINNVLKSSYDGLDSDEKNIFLDIACFFKGEKRDRVIEILESFGFSATRGIDLLLRKALITISDANKIEMHDLIQEMGRKIVLQESEKCPENRSRLWKHEEVFDVLKKNKGTEDVEGIILDLSKLTANLNLSSSFLANMPNCRFLKIYTEKFLPLEIKFNVYLQDGLTSLSQNLRYIHWDKCSLKSWPPNFCCAEQLVELHIQFGYAKKLWDGVQNLINLKSIDLSYSTKLVEIPDLSKAEKLEKVSLCCCFELHQLHPSMLSLPKLTYLDLGCSEIESLESNVHSKTLEKLILKNCYRLKKFSVTSDAIKVLDLTETSISSLSLSAGHLLSLEVLRLSGTNIEILSENMKNLSMLGEFQEKECQKVVSLPQLPSSLIELHLNEYEELEHLPELPPSLKELRLYGCKKLKHLPPKLPRSLEHLNLYGCEKLQHLPELPLSLQILDLHKSRELVSLPQLPSSLKELYLGDCLKLESLPELPLSLRVISLDGCCELESLPKLPPSLSKIPLNNCKKLVSLPPELPSNLTELYLNDCRKLVSLPPELPSNLTKLCLNDCRKLVSLPKLPLSMRELALNNCLKLISLPKLPSSVELVSTINCISLDTVITKGLVLKHMCQIRIPYLHQQYLNNPKFHDVDYFVFPIDHINNKSGFHTAESSLTIPDLPKSDLLGFICYIIFYNERELDDAIWDEGWGENNLYVSIDIYQDGKQIRRKLRIIECPINLISDHVLFSYLDICRFDGISEVCDQFSNITFKFELKDYRQEARIKGCGVFPVYATTSGLKLFNSSTKAGHDQEIGVLQDSQISNNEAQASTTEVECSNNENKDGWEQQLLHASKRQRTSP